MVWSIPPSAFAQGLFVGPNVNMVSGTQLPNGDPWLQRQNEPSLAVSTRNACTLLAGANDYRTVDMPGDTGDNETGDGWLGLFKSYDCGRTWITGLLSGYPQDTSPDGLTSPLKGLQAAADAIVRAGTNGQFYYSGIAFNRGAGGLSKVFVARLEDTNDQRRQADSIVLLGTSVVDIGTKGQFIDKPFLAVDIPRGVKNAKYCTIDGQQVASGPVYIAWTRFVGDPVNNVTKLMVSRSRDCGVTWEQPVKVSEGYMTNQGATMAVAPDSGALYVAWRQFLSDSGQNAILVSKSTDFGGSFSKASIVATINPFDQGTSPLALSFRTNSYPAMAVDATGRVYVGWSQRGVGPGGDARIVLSTSTNGSKWSAAAPVDNYAARGNQIMPSITVGGGKVQVLYYDLQDDHFLEMYTRFPGDPWPYAIVRQWTTDNPSDVFGDAVADNYPVAFNRRHSIDVRTAQADAGSSNFTSARVSNYAFGTFVFTGDSQNLSRTFWQMSFNPPNLPLYAQGTSPFIGDYIDVATVAFVRDPVTGAWKFNAAATPGVTPTFHAVWTDNRDVSPPPPGGSWANYTPPRAGCTAGTTGMRNANIYTAAIMPPLVVGSLDNSKPLKTDAPRAFSVFGLNTTGQDRRYTFTIAKGTGVSWASFDEGSDTEQTSADVWIGAWSGVARTVYAKGSTTGQLTVTVTEAAASGTSQGSVVINADPLSPPLSNPAMMNESYNGALMDRTIVNPAMMNPAMMNPAMMNPAMMNPADPAWALVNPAMMNPAMMNPAMMNPAMMNPAMMNPAMMNPGVVSQEVADPAMMNPAMMNPAMMNPAVISTGLPDDGMIIDVTWKLRNEGTSASSYSINLSGNEVPTGLRSQLILHKRYVTPAPTTSAAMACEVGQRTQDVVLANIADPLIAQADAGGLAVNDPRLENATMALAPGEEGYATLRIFDPDRKDNVVTYDAQSGRYYAYDPKFDPRTDVTIQPVPQPANEPPVPTGTYTVAFVGQPQNAQAGQPLGNVQVRVNQSGAGVGGALVTITLIPNGNGGMLAGTFTAATNGDGIATFGNLAVSEAGTGYRLRASVPGASAAVSSLFDISPVLMGSGASTGTLVFIQQPSASRSGQPIQGVVAVAAHDATSAPVPGVAVTLSLGSNPAGASLSNAVSVTDPAGVAYFPTVSLDRGGYGYTLVAQSGAISSNPSVPFDVAGFVPTGSMSTPRVYATATRLLDGRVLVAGGQASESASTPLNSAEVYGPGGVFAPTAGTLATARRGHAATLLADGRVLVSGGYLAGSGNYPPYTSGDSELYDPSTNSFAPGPQIGSRAEHSAVLLTDGRVLVAGGARWSDGAQASAEFFDPVSGTVTATGDMTTARYRAGSTILASGRVLVAGGMGAAPLSTAEVFDPLAGTFSPTGSMTEARQSPTTTLLPDGRVLIAGGIGSGDQPLATAEIYDPATGQFGATGSMASARTGHTAVLLPSGLVLVSGGYSTWPTALLTAELYDPSTGTFTQTGVPLTGRRVGQLAALLNDGTVLVTGGSANSAELFYPVPPAAPTSLAFSAGPAPLGTMSQTLPEVRVQLVDGGGAPLGRAGVPVVLSLSTNPSGAGLTGNTAMTDASGVAIFSALRVDKAGAGYALRAASLLDTVLPSAAAPSLFAVQPGTLAFEPAVGSIADGSPLNVTVRATRAEGGPMAGSVLAEVLPSAPGPTTSLAAVLGADGLAHFVFSGLSVGNYSVQASMTGAAAINSGLFSVINAVPVAITATPLPPPIFHESFTGLIETSGGIAPRTVSVTAGALPPGVTLSTTGQLSGMPARPGNYSFTVTVTDSTIPPLTATRSYELPAFAVDQYQWVVGTGTRSFGTSGAGQLAQIVVSNAAGVLGGVRVSATCQAGDDAGNPPRLGAYVYAVDEAGRPQGPELASGYAVVPATGPHVPGTTVTLMFGSPVPVAPGFRHALVLNASGSCTADTASYYFGNALAHDNDVVTDWYSIPDDLWFDTLVVTPPEVVYPPNWIAAEWALDLADGRVLIGNPFAKEIYDPTTGDFAAYPAAAPGSYGSATRLLDGRVLSAGGIDVSGATTAIGQIFNPSTGLYTATGPMQHSRGWHTGTLLPDGRVLIAGGQSASGGVYSDVLTAEIFDPTSGTFSDAGVMAGGRHAHTATLLKDGRVLVAGGNPQSGPSPTAEIYDTASGTFTATADHMLWQRAEHTATLLSDGRVLLAGGASVHGVPVQNAEVFDPALGTFTDGGALLAPRLHHGASLLPDGSVAVAGGRSSTPPPLGSQPFDMGLASVEIWTPSSGKFVAAGNLAVGRAWASAISALADGSLLVAGGNDGSTKITPYSVERFVRGTQQVLLTNGALPPASNGVGYFVPLTATGGTPPYAFAAVSGALPPGLALKDGSISGVPAVSEPATFVFTLEVRDSLGSASYQALAIAVNSLVITTTMVPPAVQDVAYSAQVLGAGWGSLSWSIVGTPPPGLGISGSGVISGTPSAAGTYAFFVDAVDSAGQQASREFTITVGPSPAAVSFSVQPARATAGQAMPSLTLRVADSSNTPIPNVPVTLGLVTNPGPGTLSGSTTSVTNASGLAQFTDVTIDRGGYGYQLIAYAGSVTSPVSNAFDVVGFAPTGNTAGRAGSAVATLPDGRVLVAGGGWDAYVNTAELYDPATGSFRPTGSMAVARYQATATLLPNGKVLVAGGYTGSEYTTTAELFDPAAGTFTPTGSMNLAHPLLTATLLADGTVLVVGNASRGEIYDPTTGSFTMTAGLMRQARYSHTATLLPDGSVLLAGGWAGGTAAQSSSETYDPASGTFSVAGAMSIGRVYHSATPLPDGRVLIAGGYNGADVGPTYDTAEAYDPVTRTFTLEPGLMTNGRSEHVAAALPSGHVLVAGGLSAIDTVITPTTTADLYEPASGLFSRTGDTVGLGRDRAVLLSNGSVLLVGGGPTAELFRPADPPYATAGFEAGVPLQAQRRAHTATRLPNGLVLIAGGYDSSGAALASAELCSPVTGTCTSLGSMTVARARHTATLLPNGRVLLVGGDAATGAAAELFDPRTNAFTATASLHQGRYYHTATLLGTGNVLVTGGSSAAVAEIYRPSLGIWDYTSGAPLMGNGYYSAAALLPDGRVLVVGDANNFTQLYDPASDGFVLGPTMGDSYSEGFTLTALPNGKVLLVGHGAMTTARLYDPAVGSLGAFGPVGAISQARSYHTSTVLPNGLVLVAGGGPGLGSYSTPVATGDLFDPLTNSFSSAGAMSDARGGHTAVVLGNGKLWIAGGRNAATMAVATADGYRSR